MATIARACTGSPSQASERGSRGESILNGRIWFLTEGLHVEKGRRERASNLHPTLSHVVVDRGGRARYHAIGRPDGHEDGEQR